jgi:hypothetical protein
MKHPLKLESNKSNLKDQLHLFKSFFEFCKDVVDLSTFL